MIRNEWVQSLANKIVKGVDTNFVNINEAWSKESLYK